MEIVDFVTLLRPTGALIWGSNSTRAQVEAERSPRTDFEISATHHSTHLPLATLRLKVARTLPVRLLNGQRTAPLISNDLRRGPRELSVEAHALAGAVYPAL